MTILETTCEYAVNPLGIDNPQPRLSWVLASDQRGAVQQAYHVLVASSPEKLAADEGDRWDSGRVESAQSVNVPFGGAVLESGEKCFWKVRVWSDGGTESPWSNPATFEMGLLSEKDWLGSGWISAPAGEPKISSPLLRKEIVVDAPVRRARIYLCGLGYHELRLNGSKVGDHLMDPAPTLVDDPWELDVHHRALYVTHDVTDALAAGANTVGVMLGHGWYSHDPDNFSGRKPLAEQPVLRLMMLVELTDGRTLTLGTDTTWKVSPGPIAANDICGGETYDARAEQTGWDAPGYDDSAWPRAVGAKGPRGRLVAQPLEPIRIVQRYKPTRVLKTSRGTHIIDFGQYVSGFTELRVSGPAGTTIAIEHAGRIMDGDDELDTRNNRHFHEANQTDRYTLKGEGVETWHPRFTVHGFRFVEITGWPGEPTADDLTSLAVNNDIASAGTFACSDDLLNQIDHNARMTFRGSFQGIPQDAADRAERVAWLGDPGYVAEDYMLTFFDARFWSKWVDDIADAQKPDGSVPFVAPPNWGPDSYKDWPCWECSYSLFVWFVYQYYDDVQILAKHYEGLRRQVEHFRKLARGGPCPEPLGDHMEPQMDGSKRSSFAPTSTPADLTGTAYYQRCAWILSQAARILNKKTDFQQYARLADQIRTLFNEQFFNYETNSYASGSQTAQALPLYLGLVPAGREGDVLSALVEKIEEQGGHLSTGIIGTDALEQALGACGRADVMYTIATQTTYPSWGYGVTIGQTTIPETLECDNDHSVSMKMFASCEKFFHRDVAGLGLAGLGYRRINVAPKLVDELDWANATLRTVRGTAGVDWKKSEGMLTLTVTVPVNSSATVAMPTQDIDTAPISESGNPVWIEGAFVEGAQGITAAVEGDSTVVFEVGSGTYTFSVPWI